MLCSSQFAASPFVTILGCFVSFPLSYFVSAYLSSDTLVLLKEPNNILFILLYLSQPYLGWLSFARGFFFFGINADG